MYGLLTKCEVKIAGYIGQVLFLRFMNRDGVAVRDGVKVHKLAKKEQGQYSAILTEQTWGAYVWEYSGIRMYSGIYSGNSAPASRIARMESRYSGMRIAPKQTFTCIIPIILIPD